MVELLLDFAERDALPDLVDGRAVPKVPTIGWPRLAIAADHLHTRGDRRLADQSPAVAVRHRALVRLLRSKEVPARRDAGIPGQRA